MTLLRSGGNPNHKGTGLGGGQFTSGGGSSHGKHYAKRQRKKKKRLEDLRKKGHARIAEVKAKQASERKALRSKHRKQGTGYSARWEESKALRAKHEGERRQTINSIKKEVHEAFPRTKPSDKAKEFRERVEKGSQKLAERHSKEREGMASRQHEAHTKLLEGHKNERKELASTLKSERAELRAKHADERKGLIDRGQADWREDARYILKQRDRTEEHKKADLEHTKEVHASRLKSELKSQRESHRDELEGHRASSRDEVVEQRQTHQREHRELLKGHQAVRQGVTKAHKMERREAINRLKQELQARGFDVAQYGTDGSLFPGTVPIAARGAVESAQPPTRFGKRRTHKASNAESILSHVLRQRGWSKLYRLAELSGKQLLSLLEDVRQYGRAWMRHEAEAFFDRYGVEDERALSGIRVHDGESPGDSEREGLSLGDIRNADADREIIRGIAERASGALSRFFRRAHQFIHELIIAGSMALKGSSTLSAGEISALDRQARVQAEYLQKFEREVTLNPPLPIADLSNLTILAIPPPMTPGQFIARAEQYGNAVWQVQNIGREVVIAQKVFAAERRVHKLSGLEHHPCKTCIGQSLLGWQTPGTLLEIGDSECMNSCDCYFEWQDPKGKIYVSPWGRHNPKSYSQPGSPGTDLPGIAYPPDDAIPLLPSGPGPAEKPKPKRPPAPPRPAPKKPTVDDLIQDAGGPWPGVDYHYEEAP